MIYAEATKAIKQQWLDNWPTLSGNLPSVFDDELADDVTRYARLQIDSLPSNQWTMGSDGNRIYRRNGMIKVKLIGPIDEGSTPLDAQVGYVNSIFEGKRFGAGTAPAGVIGLEAFPRPMGTDGSDWTIMVYVPFRFDEIK